MDFKSLLSQLDQLNEAKKPQVEEGRSDEADDDYDAEAEAEKAEEKAEAKRKADREEIDEGIMDEPATKETPTGRIHKAKPGGYGRKDDEDDEGKKVKADAPKRGRGRPKKGGDETGEVKKYDWSAFGAGKKDVKLPKWDKSKTTKHSLKEWVEEIENKYLTEGAAQYFYLHDVSLIDKLASMDGVDVDTDEGAMDDEDGHTVGNGEVSGAVVTSYNPNVTKKLMAFAQKNPTRLSVKQVAMSKNQAEPVNGNWGQDSSHGLTESTTQYFYCHDVSLLKQLDGWPGVSWEEDEGAMDDEDGHAIGNGNVVGATIESNNPAATAKLLAFAKKNPTRLSIKQSSYKNDNANGISTDFNSPDLAEAEQIQIKPASQLPKTPGQSSIKPGQPQQVQGQPKKNTQVIQQGNKTLGTVDNPQLAQQIKQSIGKGEMTLMPGEEQMAEAGEFRQNYTPEPVKKPGLLSKLGNVAKKVADKVAPGDDELLAQLRKSAGVKAQVKEADIPADQNDMGAGLGAGRSQATLEGKDEGKPGKNFAKIAKSAGEKYGSKAAGERVAGAVRAKLAKQGKLEEAKPDFLDLDKDGDKKESMKKAAKDKKAVKESAEHRLKAAHHRGKAHALAKESYNCKYDDMEEARMYHEGFKEGLDECYGQMPIQGMVGESEPAIVDDMASFGAHHDQDVEEGNAFTAALARTPAGGQFKVGGKTFTDRSGYDSSIDEMAFESWDKELSNLLTENEKVDEGMTVSISKGQQGAPDSVSVSAQDQDADALLSLIKQAGLGLFGNDDQPQHSDSTPMSVAVDGEPAEVGADGAEIDVVDDHDGMMSLIKKMTGGAVGGSEDYADEEGHEEHEHEETCDACGSADCECDSEEEVVDEVQSEDQMEYQVAEDNPPDSGAEEVDAEDQEIAADNAAASPKGGANDEEIHEGGDGGEASEEEDEEQVEESYANSTDDGYEADINFIMKAIAGGLNKEKSTGQTTIPVIAGQTQRTGVNESLGDWKKLAGI